MPNVTVELDHGFPEIQIPGWKKMRLAGNFQPAVFVPNPALGGVKLEKATLSQYLWREPNTGVLMLKPMTLHADFWENEDKFLSSLLEEAAWRVDSFVNPTGIVFGTPTSGTILTIPKAAMYSVRETASASFSALTVDAFIATLLPTYNAEMVPVAQLKESLAINEGFTVWVHPPGIYTDRAKDYEVITFGRKYALHLRMDGTATLQVDINYVNGEASTTDGWKEVAVFKFSQGGVDHGKPFQVTVIPWGYEYITFLFTQSAEPSKQTRSSLPTNTKTTFLYQCSKYEGKFPREDKISKQWVKTEAAPITVILRRDLYNYGMAFARIKYPTAQQLIIWNEDMPCANDAGNPSLFVQGFQGQRKGSAGGTQVISTYTNHKNLSWNASQDTKPTVKLTLYPDDTGTYTPEIWNYELTVPTKVWTPPWTPEDITDLFSFIRIQKHNEPDTAKAEMTIVDDSSRFSKILKMAGHPFRISIDGPLGEFVAFDGYYDRNMPTLENIIPQGITSSSTSTKNTAQFTAFDMWARLNETFVDEYTFLDGLNMLDVLKSLLNKAGFSDDYIFVDDPTGYIGSFTFESFQTPDDWKAISPDASVGDVIRLLFKNYWARPIRLVWKGTYWHIYAAPTYTYVHNSPPALRFSTVTPADVTDSTRWGNGLLKVKDRLEFTQEKIDFNFLIGRCVRESGEGADGYAAYIPNTTEGSDPSYDYFAWRSTNDPTYPWFVGRTIVKVVQPPTIMLATSLKELEKITRIYYERFAKKRPRVEFLGEWLPGIEVDTIFWLTGRDPSGNMVSYGAYVIDHMDIQIRFNWANMTWAYECRYTATLKGKATTTDIPMYTTDDNIPL